MTTTAITTTTPAMPELTPAIVKRYICTNATDAEVYVFIQLCMAQGLNPFLRDAYLVKYDGNQPATIVVGKDTFTKRAEEHPQYTGFKAGVIVVARDGVVTEREGTFYTTEETLAGGWAEVYRSDRSVPMRTTVRLSEYDSGRSNWKRMPATMIRKVALVQALREAFPTAFRGLYDAAEMGMDPDTLPTNVIDSTATELPPTPRAEPPAEAVMRLTAEMGWANSDTAAAVRQMYDGRTFKELTMDEKRDFVAVMEGELAKINAARDGQQQDEGGQQQ